MELCKWFKVSIDCTTSLLGIVEKLFFHFKWPSDLVVLDGQDIGVGMMYMETVLSSWRLFEGEMFSDFFTIRSRRLPQHLKPSVQGFTRIP